MLNVNSFCQWVNGYRDILSFHRGWKLIKLIKKKLQTMNYHYNDVIMGAMTSHITSLTIVYSTVYSDTDQRKHQNSASLAFVRGIHRGPVNSPHKWPVTGKCFHLMTSSWLCKPLATDTGRADCSNHGDALAPVWTKKAIIIGLIILSRFLKAGEFPGCEWWSVTHWGRVTHVCVNTLNIIGSDNGLSPGRRQAIIWTNDGILLIWPLGTNFNEIWIRIHIFSFKEMVLKMSSAKCRPFCLGLNVLKMLFCKLSLWETEFIMTRIQQTSRTWVVNISLIEKYNETFYHDIHLTESGNQETPICRFHFDIKSGGRFNTYYRRHLQINFLSWKL